MGHVAGEVVARWAGGHVGATLYTMMARATTVTSYTYKHQQLSHHPKHSGYSLILVILS